MSYEVDQAHILAEIADYDEQVVAETDARLRELKRDVMALLAILVTSGAMAYYYKNIMDHLTGLLGDFNNAFRSDVDRWFAAYWGFGLRLSEALAKAQHVAYTPPITLDKQVLRNYLLDEATSEVNRLAMKLKFQLKQAVLSGGDVEQVLKGMGALLADEKTTSALLGRLTSELVGVVDIVQNAAVQDMAVKAPEKVKGLTKTWNWSHVSRVNHAAIDGTTIPLSEKFHVPGWGSTPSAEMDGPHDPSAPAGQVLNCKCYLTIGGTNG